MSGSNFRFVLVLLLPTLLGINLRAQAPSPESSSKSHGYTKSPGRVPDAGVLADNVYRNPSFGFSYKVPYGWVDRSPQMKESEEAGKSMLLLAVFERPPEATGDTVNSAVVITAEKISQFSGLKNAADYFGPITELATAKGFKVISQPYDFPVSGHTLVRGDFAKERGRVTMQQTSLVTVEKGYAVSFAFIGGSEDEVNELIDNLRFAPGKGAR
ncbi:MAG TPA: hypothetical protein VFA89_18625 [Terriglobales bacterium]|nr:hypothetical protein [Terriglobales bacterium]